MLCGPGLSCDAGQQIPAQLLLVLEFGIRAKKNCKANNKGRGHVKVDLFRNQDSCLPGELVGEDYHGLGLESYIGD